MPNPPRGEVTFIFSDIEAATRLWEEQPAAMQAAVSTLDSIVRPIISALGGYLFKAAGDAYYAAYADPASAIATATAIAWQNRATAWGSITPKLRIAIHTGTAEFRTGDYFGATLNRTARILAASHGDQILISASAVKALADHLPAEFTLRSLGERRLKDLPQPESIYQLIAPDLPTSFPPLNTLDRRPNNLPAPPNAFIGRQREVAAITAMLRRSDVRLITLTGPGGTGKTRLSIKVGADMLDEFAAGVYFVPLSSSTAPTLVAATIAQTLGLNESPDQPPLAALKEYLRDKQMLLLLDNFEQVVDAAAMVAELLAAARGLKVIVTSRIMLHAAGEHEYLVPPLDLPATNPLPPLEQLSQYAAVALFIQRAQAVRPDFAVTNANAPAVAQICALLDGLPLAIELAAARSRTLSPEEILTRLDNRLNLLTGGFRDQPDRQRTIRGAIDWSYDLLDAEEQRLFRRLGVFIGGWTLAAATAVASAADEPPLDVADGLSSLIDKSLLRQSEGAGGETRYGRLGVIREYALEKLTESGEEAAVRRRHAEYHLTLAEQAEAELTGAEQAYWLNRLEQEHENLRAALNWCLTNDAPLGIRLAGALGRFWRVRGHVNEGRRWFAAALQHSEVPDGIRAKAYFWAGAIEGDFSYAQALELLETALRLFRAADDAGGVARTLNLLGIVVQDHEDYERAAHFYEESLALQRELDDKHGIAVALANLAWVELNRGNYEHTVAMEQESQTLLRELGDQFNLAMGISNLGNVALLTDNYERAVALYEESIAMQRELGNTRGVALALFFLSLTKLAQSKVAEARLAVRESLTMLKEIEADSDIPITIWGMAGVASAEGQAHRAAAIFAASEAQRKVFGASLPPAINLLYQRLLDVTRAQLDVASFAAGWAEGEGMTLEQTVAYALDDDKNLLPRSFKSWQNLFAHGDVLRLFAHVRVVAHRIEDD